MNARKALTKIFGTKASRRRTMTLTYGLFCLNTEFALAPAAVFYTRFAAERKCRELNGNTANRWSIRALA